MTILMDVLNGIGAYLEELGFVVIYVLDHKQLVVSRRLGLPPCTFTVMVNTNIEVRIHPTTIHDAGPENYKRKFELADPGVFGEMIEWVKSFYVETYLTSNKT